MVLLPAAAQEHNLGDRSTKQCSLCGCGTNPLGSSLQLEALGSAHIISTLTFRLKILEIFVYTSKIPFKSGFNCSKLANDKIY